MSSNPPLPRVQDGCSESKELHIRHIAWWLRATVNQFDSTESKFQYAVELGAVQRQCIRDAADHYEALSVVPPVREPQELKTHLARVDEMIAYHQRTATGRSFPDAVIADKAHSEWLQYFRKFLVEQARG